jgi:hypothetical protein
VVAEVRNEHSASNVTINEKVTDDVFSQQSIIKHSLRDVFQRYLVKELQMQIEHVMHFFLY